MRFYKSVKICKGVRLNFSKSGVGMSIGPRGAKISIGPRGTYLNTSIPGTGISQRRKIGSGTSSNRSRSASNSFDGPVTIGLNNEGKMSFYDAKGRIITDPTAIRRIKNTASYKEEVQRLRFEMKDRNAQIVDQYNEKNADLINVVSMAPNVLSPQYYSTVLKRIKPRAYKRNSYTLKPPDEEAIRAILQKEAEEDINGWKKWEVSRKRKEYVEKYCPSAMQDALDTWEYNKSLFEEQEDIKEKEANIKAAENCKRQKEALSKLIEGDEKTVSNNIESFLSDIEMPFDFSVNYELRDRSTVFVDLDLPEIEMLPDQIAVQMANGTVKKKKITQANLKQNYIKCVFGFAVVFAAKFFNSAPTIKNIILSGFTQRRDKNGSLNDVYIYSIKFLRDEMELKTLSGSDPYELCMQFENRCLITKSGIMKEVVPFG